MKEEVFVKNRNSFLLTVNSSSRVGKRFIKTVLNKSKHPIYATDNPELGYPWIDYRMFQEDYEYLVENLLRKEFEVESN